jgi:hypothetical protein
MYEICAAVKLAAHLIYEARFKSEGILTDHELQFLDTADLGITDLKEILFKKIEANY